jgi:hypothetical protein
MLLGRGTRNSVLLNRTLAVCVPIARVHSTEPLELRAYIPKPREMPKSNTGMTKSDKSRSRSRTRSSHHSGHRSSQSEALERATSALKKVRTSPGSKSVHTKPSSKRTCSNDKVSRGYSHEIEEWSGGATNQPEKQYLQGPYPDALDYKLGNMLDTDKAIETTSPSARSYHTAQPSIQSILTSSRNIPLLPPPGFAPENVVTTKTIEVQPKIEPYYPEPEPNAYPAAEFVKYLWLGYKTHQANNEHDGLPVVVEGKIVEELRKKGVPNLEIQEWMILGHAFPHTYQELAPLLE